MKTPAFSRDVRNDATPPSSAPVPLRPNSSDAHLGRARSSCHLSATDCHQERRPSTDRNRLLACIAVCLLALTGFAVTFGLSLPALSSHDRHRRLGAGVSSLGLMMVVSNNLPSYLLERFSQNDDGKQTKASDDRRPASYARYSSDNQNESSISDQQRECRNRAASNSHSIASDFEFSDSAVSGTVRDRDGLNALIAAVRKGHVSVVYFHSLSRLARDSVFTLTLISEFVHERSTRVISINDNVDTIQGNWELVTALFAIQHAQYSKELSQNVRRGQKGNISAGRSGGDYCWGYTSVPSADGRTKRRSGVETPCKDYAIEPESAEWVKKLFHWYVHERRPISWIMAELNRNKVPKDHRARKAKWHRSQVVGALRNPKYIGIWIWGQRENVRVPGKKVKQVLRPADEYLQDVRHFPELRLIDDATFELAQQRLNEQSDQQKAYRKKNGTLTGSSGQQTRKHLLSGLLKCGQCGETLYVGGNGGDYLLCTGHRDKVCSNHMQLPTKLATSKLLTEISRRIDANDAWFNAIVDATAVAWQRQIASVPGDRVALERELTDVERKISRLLDQMEGTDSPDPDLKSRLRDRRQQKESLQRRLREIDSRQESTPAPPTPEVIRLCLGRLHEVLRSNTPKANQALHGLLGGPITVNKATVPTQKRAFWRGTVKFSLPHFMAEALPEYVGSLEEMPVGDLTEEVTLDFRRPLVHEAHVVRAWELLQQGLRQDEIGEQLGLRPAKVTAVMKLVAEEYGEGMTPAELRTKYCHRPRGPLAFEQFVGPAMERLRQGMLMQDIAKELGTHRDMITAAIKAGHEELGLRVPDGRKRRTFLEYKGMNPNAGRKSRSATDTPLPPDDSSIADQAT